MRVLTTLLFGAIALCGAGTAALAGVPAAPDALARGVAYCNDGHYHLALEALQAAYRAGTDGAQRATAAGELGLAYLRMRQPAQAEPLLRDAYRGAAAPERARFGIGLANLLAGRKQTAQAQRIYDEALKLAGADVKLAVSVMLNQAQLSAGPARLAQLAPIEARLGEVPDLRERARLFINLGAQARASGAPGLALAWRALDAGRALAQQAGDGRLQAEALDQLAQLYEDQQRRDDAMALTERGLLAAQTADAHDLQIGLQWRRGRLLQHAGQPEAALGAYQRAVDHIEAIRQDIPVEYQDGRSSFRETLEPVYLGLADLLLQQAAKSEPSQHGTLLRRARDVVELIKQSELSDFLGDRCSVESVRTAAGTASIAAGTAVLYPIILPKRLELLVETRSGLQRRTVAIDGAALRQDVLNFAAALRANRPYQEQVEALYRILLQPLEAIIERESIDTMVVVPDGVLRLLPFGALHDGQRFAIEKYAIAAVPGLTMTSGGAALHAAGAYKTLLAGVSEPGEVVEKLPPQMTAQLLASPTRALAEVQQAARAAFADTGLRNIKISETEPAASADSAPFADAAERHQKLQQQLALSGVREEIEMLGKMVPGATLLNQDFSVQAFSRQVESGDFRVVHIASHGVFGGSADTTFIMAHDDVITIDRLQGLLRAPGLNRNPIELLTLSACETAEGDDRAPLGLSGAALKARAKSALGSLWPVSDEAAKVLMGAFYRELAQDGASKARALQQAQLRLLEDKNLRQPYFWAPFIMVGSWQ